VFRELRLLLQSIHSDIKIENALMQAVFTARYSVTGKGSVLKTHQLNASLQRKQRTSARCIPVTSARIFVRVDSKRWC
jgi:hypothetical protein